MQLKTCTKCKKELPADLNNFYRNAGGKFGVTPRCKSCVNEDNKASHNKRKEEDPEKIRKQATARAMKHYHANLERSRERARLSAQKALADPERKKKIYARKRAGNLGLSIEEMENLFKAQGYKCAICETQEPQEKSGVNGWNVDHCHKTKKLRFILCNHCNRGLGAFKDMPSLMRKAADVLEAYQNQGDHPVEAIDS